MLFERGFQPVEHGIQHTCEIPEFVFGVGFLREWLDSRGTGEKQQNLQVETAKLHEIKAEIDALNVDDYKQKVELMETHKAQKKKIKAIKRALRENYVKRGLVKKIIAAWIITVPAAATVSAIVFYVLKGLAL